MDNLCAKRMADVIPPIRPWWRSYIIQSGDHAKIGIAKKATARIDTLQTGAPHQLKLLDLAFFESRSLALEFEEICHERAPNRTVGEWFAGPDMALAAFQRILAELCDKGAPGVWSAPRMADFLERIRGDRAYKAYAGEYLRNHVARAQEDLDFLTGGGLRPVTVYS